MKHFTSRNGSVLIVSADPALSEGIRWALERVGMDSTLATDPVEAVQRLAWDAPAAIVVDLRFQEMEADQIVRRAIVCRETHGVPIIALGDHPEDADSLLDSGCAAALPRDSAPQSLAEIISQLVHARLG